jgi:hypothetical protein
MSDVIDSRDLLNELRGLLEDSSYDYSDDPADDPETWPAYNQLDQDERERVQMLRDVLAELPDETVDSPHGNSWGCTLIPEDDFAEYAEEFAADIGAINRDAEWPLNHINWEAAAEALKADYTRVDLDGTTYLAR